MHFSYLQDPKNPHRRLTVARTVEDGKITFATAMNKCLDESTLSWKETSEYIGDDYIQLKTPRKVLKHKDAVPVDVFNRKLGRAIAGGLCAKKGVTLPQVEGEAPLATVLKHLLSTGESHVVKRIAEAHLHTAPV